ncbi:MAG TPA: hypothetical protein VGL86_28980, partial [Polyangia bacterium]
KSPTEALATDEMSLRGMFAMGVRHLLRNDALAKKTFEQLSSFLFPGTTLRNSKSSPKEDTREPVALTFDIDASSALQAEDDDWRLRLPGNFELARLMDLKHRETPLRLGPPASSSYDIETTLPDGYAFRQTPHDYDIEHACFTLKRKSRVESGHLFVRVDYQRKCTDVAPDDYADLRAAVQRAAQHFQDTIAFAKSAVAPAKATHARHEH